MASTSSLKSVIKSEQFPCHRVPTQVNRNIPPVIVINDAGDTSSSTNKPEEAISNGVPASSSTSAAGQPAAPSTAKQTNNSNGRPKYGRVVISLENPVLPDSIINNTPSFIDGLDAETENDLRITGCKLIQISGILLRLPQVAMATGQVLFQRYYYCKSFVRFPMEITAMACVVLASKVEEAPRRIRDIINVFHNMKQIRLKQPTVPMLLNEAYVNLKNQVIKAERRILKELGFCVHVKHPHKYIITVAEILGLSKNTELIQSSWSYMNDSLQTNVFLRHSPETIACACIHLSARVLRVPLPTSPPWYRVFGVETETIKQVCTTILQLYARNPTPQEELEEKVEQARKAVDDAKLKAKAQIVAQNAENSTATSLDSIVDSRTSSPIKYGDGGSANSKSLEILSVINRLKANRGGEGSYKTTPLLPTDTLKSTLATSQASSVANSASNTPNIIKLEKSPRSFGLPGERTKRSRSPYERDYRRNSRERPHHTDSSGDDRRSPDRSRSRHRNGHHRYDDYEEEESAHRPRDTDNSYIPRSYISSTVTVKMNDYPEKYQRRSRSPSYESDRYHSRYNSSSTRDRESSRYDEAHYSSSRHESHSRSRKDYDGYESRSRADRGGDRDRSHGHHHRAYDDVPSRSRSPSGYRSRDYHKSSSGGGSKRY